MRKLRATVYVLCLLLIGYAFLCFRLADRFLQPRRLWVIRPRGVIDLVLPSSVGSVPCWATPNWHEASVVFILAHGYDGSRQVWGPLMPALQRAGYAAVAPSMNGQDASPDRTVGFGFKEARTIVDTVNWVREQRGDRPKIILLGVSLGGAACWLATELDASVDAVVSEGAFADLPSAMAGWLNVHFSLGSFFLAPAVWIASSKAGLDPARVRPVDAARRWHGRPALVIQAGADRTIARRHADELSEAAGAPLWVVPDAGHAKCVETDLRGYVQHLRQVVARVLRG
jgi:pimeloyl-ACP methyl ester carboxylesterase